MLCYRMNVVAIYVNYNYLKTLTPLVGLFCVGVKDSVGICVVLVVKTSIYYFCLLRKPSELWFYN